MKYHSISAYYHDKDPQMDSYQKRLLLNALALLHHEFYLEGKTMWYATEDFSSFNLPFKSVIVPNEELFSLSDKTFRNKMKKAIRELSSYFKGGKVELYTFFDKVLHFRDERQVRMATISLIEREYSLIFSELLYQLNQLSDYSLTKLSNCFYSVNLEVTDLDEFYFRTKMTLTYFVGQSYHIGLPNLEVKNCVSSENPYPMLYLGYRGSVLVFIERFLKQLQPNHFSSTLPDFNKMIQPLFKYNVNGDEKSLATLIDLLSRLHHLTTHHQLTTQGVH